MDGSENPSLAEDAPAEAVTPARLRRRILRYGPLAVPLAVIFASGIYLATNNLLFPNPTSFPTELGGTKVAEMKKIGGDTVSVVSDLPPEQVGVPSPKPSDPRWAFLLLGYGGGSHDGAYLTDSMVLAIADPTKKTLALLSIPRDSWVPQLFDGKTAVYNKLNTAYAFSTDQSLYRNRLPRYSGKQGAGRFVVDTIARLVGVPISNYVALDFSGFRQMIEAIGGIDVQVPATFTASYPVNDDPSVDPSWTTVRFVKGTEHMSGERAIQFARAREVIDNYSEGSDFARSRRQRLIMEAFKNRLFAADGLIHLPQLLAIAPRRVDSDYSIPNISQFTQLMMEWKDLNIYQAALTQDNYLQVATGPGGAYVLVPLRSDASWSPIRAFTRRLWEDPAAAVEIAATRIIVRNSSNLPGAGTRLSEFLLDVGYRVGSPESGKPSGETVLIDRTGGKAGLAVAQLAKDLGFSPRVVAETAASSPELVLELGYDHPELAMLRAAIDQTAPSSSVGIEAMGTWAPAAPEPSDGQTSGPPSSPSPVASRSPSPSPRGTGTALAVTATPLLYWATATSVVGSPTPSATPTPSMSPAAGTRTATATAPAGTYTPTPSPTSALTPAPSPTAALSPTRTPTLTAPTATRTPTPSRTATPRPSATPTP